MKIIFPVSSLFKLLIFCEFIILTIQLNSQTIRGKIINSKGEPIQFANILIKDSVSGSIKEYCIARNGFYTIKLKEFYKHIVLEVIASNYQKEIEYIKNADSSKHYIYNFSLVKDTIFALKNTTVTTKKKPFELNGDTTSFNVSAYKDGTERKIQDIIKKLPGVQLNEKTGEIKYKGNSIETVTLDGDDLFGYDYTIGTKNINVDMVDKVQAIENYTKNPLLKGIEDSRNKVALNLSLKAKKTDYSGGGDLGLGSLSTQLATEFSTNILGIAKKYKSFITASYNNIGINNTPFDYFSYNPNVSQIKEMSSYASKYIPETYFITDLDSKRTNINHSIFGSYNAFINLTKKISLKTNVYIYNDLITSLQDFKTTNMINDTQFNTSDFNTITKKPIQIKADVEVKYNLTHKTLLEYNVHVLKETINTSNDVLQNNVNFYKTTLVSNNSYFNQSLNFTAKLTKNYALQILSKHSFNVIPQTLKFLPAIYDTNLFLSNNQNSAFKKSNFNLEAKFLGNSKIGKFTVSTNLDYKSIGYDASFIGISTAINDTLSNFKNNFSYQQTNLNINGNFSFEYKKWRLVPSLKLTVLHQQLLNPLNSLNLDSISLLYDFSFALRYKLNATSAILFTPSFVQNPFTEDYFVSNPVFISNRVQKNNVVGLAIQTIKSLNVAYAINDLYRQFSLFFGINYSQNIGNYFSNFTISQNTTNIVSFYLPQTNQSVSINFNIDKLIHILKSKIELKIDYSNYVYKDIVNNSNLRNNISDQINTEFTYKTAFDLKINFANTFRYNITKSSSEGGSAFKNESIQNKFTFVIKPTKQFFIVLSNDYFLPNVSQSSHSIVFFDALVSFQTKNKLYYFTFKAQNITNTMYYQQFSVNDFSSSQFQTNLLPRLFLLTVSRNF